MSRERILMLLSIVLAVALVIVLSGVTGLPTGQFISTGDGATAGESGTANALSGEEAADRALEYINSNLVEPGTEASFVSVEETNGIYRITTNYQDTDIDIYITKDGVMLFLSDPVDTSTTPTTTTITVPAGAKVDRPVANGFIMSYCPYGLQFLKAYIPVIELLGDDADIHLNFVNYIMHGKKEIDENTRMYCMQKEQKELFTDYLRCVVVDGDYERCYDEVGVDVAQLDACVDATNAQFSILDLYEDKSTWANGQYPRYPVDDALNAQYGVGGSPTFVLNGQVTSVNRVPEAIKQAICATFNNPPEACNTQLSTAGEAAGLGPLGSGSGDSGSAQCG